MIVCFLQYANEARGFLGEENGCEAFYFSNVKNGMKLK